MNNSPLRLGIVGAGGYALAMADLVLTKGSQIQPAVQLIAVVEPDQQTHAARLAALRDQKVVTLADYDELLRRADIEAVWLPLPIALHRSYTERALAAGKAVLCEKPAAGSVQDVDAMIAARDRYQLPAIIGYQNMCEPTLKQLKEKLVSGAIGRIQRATLMACWPRPESYFHRNRWAGKFQHDGVWVMDSPPNNALAHYLQLSLFMIGQSPVSIEAELYRVFPIENFDTTSFRVTLADGATLLVLFTHACRTGINPQLVIHGTTGRAEWSMAEANLHTAQGKETFRNTGAPAQHLLERFARLMRGIPDEKRLLATLELAREQTVVVNGASEAATIFNVPATGFDRVEQDGHVFQAIRGIEDIFAQCAKDDQMLHESGRLNWTQAAGKKDLTGYAHFNGPRLAR